MHVLFASFSLPKDKKNNLTMCLLQAGLIASISLDLKVTATAQRCSTYDSQS